MIFFIKFKVTSAVKNAGISVLRSGGTPVKALSKVTLASFKRVLISLKTKL